MKMTNRVCIVSCLGVLLNVSAWAQLDQALDPLVAKVTSGQVLTEEEKENAHTQFLAYFEQLKEVNRADGLRGFSPDHQVEHYLSAFKMAIIDPGRHGGWPIRHVSRQYVFENLRTLRENSSDPLLAAACIVPAIDNQEAGYAISAYESLKTQSPYLASYILKLVRKHYSRPPAAAEFLSRVSEPVESTPVN